MNTSKRYLEVVGTVTIVIFLQSCSCGASERSGDPGVTSRPSTSTQSAPASRHAQVRWVAAVYLEMQGSTALRWHSVDGARQYEILRTIASDSPYVIIGSTKTAGYLDSDVERGDSYTYMVRCVINDGTILSSEPRTVQVPPMGDDFARTPTAKVETVRSRHLRDILGQEGMWGGFGIPRDICVDEANGLIYVAFPSRRTVLAVTLELSLVRVLEGAGGAAFVEPNGVAVDRTGTLYIADTGLAEILVFDKSGQYQRSLTLPSQGNGKSPRPLDVATGPGNSLFAIDDEGRVLGFEDHGAPRVLATVPVYPNKLINSSQTWLTSFPGGDRLVVCSPGGEWLTVLSFSGEKMSSKELAEPSRLFNGVGTAGAVDSAGRIYASGQLRGPRQENGWFALNAEGKILFLVPSRGDLIAPGEAGMLYGYQFYGGPMFIIERVTDLPLP